MMMISSNTRRLQLLLHSSKNNIRRCILTGATQTQVIELSSSSEFLNNEEESSIKQQLAIEQTNELASKSSRDLWLMKLEAVKTSNETLTPNLRRWLDRQRVLYRNTCLQSSGSNNNYKSKLEPWQISKLKDELPFDLLSITAATTTTTTTKKSLSSNDNYKSLKKGTKRESAAYIWVKYFNSLEKFYDEHGHCNVEMMEAELREWISLQRINLLERRNLVSSKRNMELFEDKKKAQKKKKKLITMEQIRLLDSIEFPWDDNELNDYVKQLLKRHVDGYSSETTDKDYNTSILKIRRGIVTKKKTQDFDALDSHKTSVPLVDVYRWYWHVLQERVKLNYPEFTDIECKKFIDEKWKSLTCEEKKFWLKVYIGNRIKKDKNPSIQEMTLENWINHFDNLEQFFCVHGHCELDDSYGPLLKWVDLQRKQVMILNDDGKEGAGLSWEKFHLLDTLHFDWQVCREKLELLYPAVTGKPSRPYYTYLSYYLSKSFWKDKKEYGKARRRIAENWKEISEEEKHAWEVLAFRQSPQNKFKVFPSPSNVDNWLLSFDVLEEFFVANGHSSIDTSHELYSFVLEIRRNKSSLSYAQEQLLRSLNFVWYNESISEDEVIEDESICEEESREGGGTLADAYKAFFRYQRFKLKTEKPRLKGHKRTAFIGKMWRNTAESDKHVWRRLVAREQLTNKRSMTKNTILDELSTQRKWMYYFDRLTKFYAHHRHSNVDVSHPSLTLWVEEQRRNKSSLKDVEVELLSSLNFDWSYDGLSVEHKYQQAENSSSGNDLFLQYQSDKIKKENPQISQRDLKRKSKVRWRQLHEDCKELWNRLELRQNSPMKNMTTKKYSPLDQWLHMFGSLETYYLENGDTTVPHTGHAKDLFYWLEDQRRCLVESSQYSSMDEKLIIWGKVLMLDSLKVEWGYAKEFSDSLRSYFKLPPENIEKSYTHERAQAFNFFSNEKHAQVKKENPDFNLFQVKKHLKTMWMGLDKGEQEIWIKLSKQPHRKN